MTGARMVHDTLEAEGWAVEIADAQKVKGLAPLACKTGEIVARSLRRSASETWCRRSGFPTPGFEGAGAGPLSPSPGEAPLDAETPGPLEPRKPRAALPVSDLFGVEGRKLLEQLEVPEPWRGNITASVLLIDDIEGQIAEANRRLKQGHADHPYVPLLMSAPGIGWVIAFTIAAEIGEIERFSSPEKLTGYTGLCPRVVQSGDSDRRGPLSKHGPRYLRSALLEGTMHALKHPAYSERYQRNRKRLGKQRGAKVAQIDIARRLAHAIWHMLSRNQPFAPRGAAFRLAA